MARVRNTDERYIVVDVSVGKAGKTARPAVFDTDLQRTIKVYRRTERARAERHATALNRGRP